MNDTKNNNIKCEMVSIDKQLKDIVGIVMISENIEYKNYGFGQTRYNFKRYIQIEWKKKLIISKKKTKIYEMECTTRNKTGMCEGKQLPIHFIFFLKNELLPRKS